MRDAPGLRQQPRDGVLEPREQEIAARPVDVAHLVVGGDVEDDGEVVLAVLAVVRLVLRAGHEHAAVVHEPRLRIDETEIVLEIRLGRRVVEILEVAHEADDTPLLVDGELRGADGVRDAAYEAVTKHAAEGLSLVEDGALVLVERRVVDVPSHFMIGLADEILGGAQAVVVEERLARAEEAARAILPEELEVCLCEQCGPETVGCVVRFLQIFVRQQAVALENLA